MSTYREPISFLAFELGFFLIPLLAIWLSGGV